MELTSGAAGGRDRDWKGNFFSSSAISSVLNPPSDFGGGLLGCPEQPDSLKRAVIHLIMTLGSPKLDITLHLRLADIVIKLLYKLVLPVGSMVNSPAEIRIFIQITKL